MENNSIKKYDLVIFDMDGTILDTLDDLRDALNYCLLKHGYQSHNLSEVRGFVGNGIRRLIERAMPSNAAEEEITKITEEFFAYYQAHCNDKTKPYNGIIQLLNTLKSEGYRTAVVSNKADFAVRKLCETYFDGLFDYAVGERAGVRKKPAPDSVLSAIDALKSKRAVYIGDSEVDIRTARNAGLDCVLVSWGFRDRDFLISQGAEVIVDRVEDILNLV